jgi:hypothetical protein
MFKLCVCLLACVRACVCMVWCGLAECNQHRGGWCWWCIEGIDPAQERNDLEPLKLDPRPPTCIDMICMQVHMMAAAQQTLCGAHWLRALALPNPLPPYGLTAVSQSLPAHSNIRTTSRNVTQKRYSLNGLAPWLKFLSVKLRAIMST